MSVPTKLNLIGPRVRQLRMDRDWTQRELSMKLRSLGWHITRDILAQMEATEHRITDCDLVFLAKALDTDVADFFPDGLTSKVRSKIHSYRLRTNGFAPKRLKLRTCSKFRETRSRRVTHWKNRHV